jgi:hypothetical protein
MKGWNIQIKIGNDNQLSLKMVFSIYIKGCLSDQVVKAFAIWCCGLEWHFYSGGQGQQVAMQGCGLGHFVQVVGASRLQCKAVV